METASFTPIDAMGGKKVLGAKTAADYERGKAIDLIRAGLPYKAVESLKKKLRLTQEEVSRFLDLAPRTLARRKERSLLAMQESDRLFRLARIYARAVQVLGDEEEAVTWLRHPSLALGSVTPLSLLETEEGARRVENELNGIEYNVYA